jgi:hypothetical protein
MMRPTSLRHTLRALPAALLGAFALTAIVAAGPALAQEPPAGCTAEGHHGFDFWIGEWEVYLTDGKTRAGSNRIEPILGGCVLLENWESASGGGGKSFNHYWAQDQKWRQTWVDSSGGRLDLVGGLEGERMVMRGDGFAQDGSPVIHEISWEPLEGGDVKQHWRVSKDGGKSWQDAFLGIYRRKAS